MSSYQAGVLLLTKPYRYIQRLSCQINLAGGKIKFKKNIWIRF
ncbi:hypothetical protein VNPA152081_61990 [Pseudomonas aeruginosa]|nr:hypothetical protein VNPA141826_60740 [Pseudomonas aeruginosa]GLF81123.1 hypothetical protein VNPA152081_61990 [Pseudomonas aeruginosa]